MDNNIQIEIKKFQRLVWKFYEENKREFPWRQTINPYRILVSEIMLQQTQTSRVVEKYKQFLKKFPSPALLAKASVPELLGLWQGLGYNRRAMHLKKTAEIVQSQYHGKIPKDIDLLVQLPGIGKATAAAICAYAYNMPVAFIETNIRRVYLHHFFKDQSGIPDSDIMPLVEASLDKHNPREWYWALMDYGSFLPKVTVNPNRKSSHYTRQSAFEGSVRQLRGWVLRYLLEHGATTKKVLHQQSKDKRLGHVVEALTAEGFVENKNGIVRLKN